jgi:16S rRNA G1207 methylase RsmC
MSSKTSQPYEQAEQFIFNTFDDTIVVFSKRGLPDWNMVSPSTALLARNSQIKPVDNLLQLGCHHGALSVSLARRVPDGHLTILENNAIALEMTRLTLQANAVTNATLFSAPDLPLTSNPPYDCAFIQAPKGRLLTRGGAPGIRALEVGGLYLAGSNNRVSVLHQDT